MSERSAELGVLSRADAEAVQALIADVSDIPEKTRDRILAGFRDAYDLADQVNRGVREAMSR